MKTVTSNKLNMPNMSQGYNYEIITKHIQEYWQKQSKQYATNYDLIPENMKHQVVKDYATKIKTKDYITIYNFRTLTSNQGAIYRLVKIFSGQIIYYDIKKRYITVKNKDKNVFSTLLGASIFVQIDSIARKPSRRKKYLVLEK